MTTTASHTTIAVGRATVVVFPHPQGCRSYLVADAAAKVALAIDPHLDLVGEMAAFAASEGWKTAFVVDTHTHADHPSGAAAIAARTGAQRVGHPESHHAGVTDLAPDGRRLDIGGVAVTLRHAPGHTPDHMVLVIDGALFSGDSLFLGSVARTDFLGGDAGRLFDTLRTVCAGLGDETVVFPGHDYQGRLSGTLGAERAGNPWLKVADRGQFITSLTANPPARPANMDQLLRANQAAQPFADRVDAAEAIARVRGGAAGSVIDVRTDVEVAAEHIGGSRHIPLDQLRARADDVRRVPAPRLLLCKAGVRATKAQAALAEMGIGGLTVISGGIDAWRAAGGPTVKAKARWSLERQVRVAAGSLVLVGVVLGVAVHPVFLGLAGFIGAGLVFAGITDWCGMGLLLAKMPWNRVASPIGGGSGPAAGGCAAAPPSCAAAPPPSCAAPPPPSS